jgi:hypothetical protein
MCLLSRDPTPMREPSGSLGRGSAGCRTRFTVRTIQVAEVSLGCRRTTRRCQWLPACRHRRHFADVARSIGCSRARHLTQGPLTAASFTPRSLPNDELAARSTTSLTTPPTGALPSGRPRARAAPVRTRPPAPRGPSASRSQEGGTLVHASPRRRKRGGRVDLAGDALQRVRVPVLLVVGGADGETLRHNRDALRALPASARLRVVPDAGHTFEEPGALGAVAEHAVRWLERARGRRSFVAAVRRLVSRT